MAIEAVLFDLDDTLLVDEADVSACFWRICGQVPGADPGELVTAVRSAARELWRACPQHEFGDGLGIASWEALCTAFPGDHAALEALRAWAPAFRRQAWAAGLAACGLTGADDPGRMADEFCRERSVGCRLFPDALPALRRLAGRSRLALVTNGPADVQRRKIAQTAIAPYFECVAISGELFAGKPDPRVFRHTLDALRVRAEQTVMIGDSPGRDVAGARAAGIRPVLLQRTPAEAPAGVTLIRSLSELPDILGQLA